MRSLLYISILPVVILLLYVYKKDIDKEPRKMLAKIFFLGCLSTVFALFLEEELDSIFSTDYINDFGTIFIYTIFGIGLPEEISKWLVVRMNAYNNKEFDHRYDAIVYSVFSGLGFACIENIIYVLSENYGIGILRALIAVPSHACNAVIMGYFLGLAKENYYKGNYNKEYIFKVLSLLMPALNHSLYDALIEYYVSSKLMIIFFIFIAEVILIYIICFKIINKVSRIKENLYEKSNYIEYL